MRISNYLLPISIFLSVLTVCLTFVYIQNLKESSVLKQKELEKQTQLENEERLSQKKTLEETKKASAHSKCAKEASETASVTLKDKLKSMESTIINNSPEYKALKELASKGMYLKDDYESYYNICLKEYGY